MLFDGTLYREIFLDGRELPKDPNPDWMGYSVGRWEGDTLMVESSGFNDRTWLSVEGHPHTEALRVTEHIRRPDFGHLEVLKTMADPGALMEPWIVPFKYEYDADTEGLEYVCNENERDHNHLVGKASDQKGVEIAREILATYVGSYEFSPPDRPDLKVSLEIVVDGDALVMTGVGPKQPLIALSPTAFADAGGTQIEFFKDDKGAVTHLIAHVVEGDIKAVRKK
jgi:hypothetical protein